MTDFRCIPIPTEVGRGGNEIDAALMRLLDDARTASVNIHAAKPGCLLCRMKRVIPNGRVTRDHLMAVSQSSSDPCLFQWRQNSNLFHAHPARQDEIDASAQKSADEK